jgi:superfamily II DNA/RNA helicase
MKFHDLDLCDDILDALEAMRFEDCTPIQAKAIPPLLEGRDLIGVAQTGTGKTAAFLLPILDSLTRYRYPEDAINCLIMAPTRELARQIDEQLQGFSYFLQVNSLAVYGGNDGPQFAQQKKGLQMGADVVISTPGRLISHLSLGYVDLSKVSFFILDEADRMLDMGFFDDIMQIASFLPKDRQTIMFSATMPPKIQKLAANILNNPTQVKIAVSRPADNIAQSVFYCHEEQKLEVVKHIFPNDKELERSLIFSSSKAKVKDIAKVLRTMNYSVGEMHSDLDQSQRDEVMRLYKAGKIDLLVATDIVSRGIDIDDIRVVVNYDVPKECEEYIHRIGRTARAGNNGRAITLVNKKDLIFFRRIEKFLNKQIPLASLPTELGTTFLPDKDIRKQNNNRRRRQQHGKRTHDKGIKKAPHGENDTHKTQDNRSKFKHEAKEKKNESA